MEIQITIKNPLSRNPDYRTTMPSTSTVLDLKQRLSQEYYDKPSVDAQRLIFKGQLLRDNQILGDVFGPVRFLFTFFVTTLLNLHVLHHSILTFQSSAISFYGLRCHKGYCTNAFLILFLLSLFLQIPIAQPQNAANYGMQHTQPLEGWQQPGFNAGQIQIPQHGRPPANMPWHMYAEAMYAGKCYISLICIACLCLRYPGENRPLHHGVQVRIRLNFSLIIKLALVVFFLSQGGSRERTTLLIIGAILIYLYQTLFAAAQQQQPGAISLYPRIPVALLKKKMQDKIKHRVKVVWMKTIQQQNLYDNNNKQ